MDRTIYTISIPGTNETRELSQESLLEELARGTIRRDFWVWSPEHEDWKQISEIPELAPAGKSAPLFVPAPIPIVPAAREKRKTGLRRSQRVAMDDDGFPFVKILFGVVYVAVLAIIGLNYFMIDKPFGEKLSQGPFILVPAHVHLGSFVQPNALVVHILPSHELNEDNFADFLCTLAGSTPEQPFQDKPFEMVALSPDWFSQFALHGADWQNLGKMKDATPEDRKNFVTDHLDNIAGQPLIRHLNRLSPGDLKIARTRVWQDLTAKFLNRG